MTTILFAGLVLYVAMGLLIGLAFVIFGVTRVQPATITVGARLLLLPGATAHVALGIMQYDRSPLIPAMLIAGFVAIAALHLVAGWRERAADNGVVTRDGWIVVGPPQAIPDKAARIVAVSAGERIAVFRDGARIGALSNLCAHQNGPIGEAASSTAV
jgi:hypothetical protein